jgi:oxaloacetate decarboxylase gamma subunit
MNGDLYTGVTLLVIGMATVFAILFLIVFSGTILIHLVNRFFPDRPPAESLSEGNEDAPGAKKLAAIAAAVDIATGGRGRAATVRKIKPS